MRSVCLTKLPIGWAESHPALPPLWFFVISSPPALMN